MTYQISLTSAIVFVSALAVSVSLHAQQTPRDDQAQAQTPQEHPPIPQGHPALPKGHPEITKQSPAPTVYETTEIEPAWRVAVRHMIVQPMGRYLHVTEVWAVHNPTDRSYIGSPVEPTAPPADGTQPLDEDNPGRTTLVLPLPVGATQVQPGPQFHACCVRVQGDKLISKMPMLPGTREYQVDYLIPAEDGAFHLTLATPAPTDHTMIFLPDDGSKVTATGLETGDPFQAGGQRYRRYTAQQLDVDTVVALVIQAPQAPLESTTGSTAPTTQAGTIKLIAGGGAGLLVLAGAFILFRPTKKPRPAGAAV